MWQAHLKRKEEGLITTQPPIREVIKSHINHSRVTERAIYLQAVSMQILKTGCKADELQFLFENCFRTVDFSIIFVLIIFSLVDGCAS